MNHPKIIRLKRRVLSIAFYCYALFCFNAASIQAGVLDDIFRDFSDIGVSFIEPGVNFMPTNDAPGPSPINFLSIYYYTTTNCSGTKSEYYPATSFTFNLVKNTAFTMRRTSLYSGALATTAGPQITDVSTVGSVAIRYGSGVSNDSNFGSDACKGTNFGLGFDRYCCVPVQCCGVPVNCGTTPTCVETPTILTHNFTIL